MTQTLTTKVLNDFITGQGYGVAPSAVEAMARELLANREAQPVVWGAPKTVGQLIGQLQTLDPAMETTALLRITDIDKIRQVPISISFERLDGQWLAPYKGEGRKVLAFWAKADDRKESERGELLTAPPAPAVPEDVQHPKNVQELYHKQEDRLFALAQRIKGASFDKYSHSTDQAISVLEQAIFGEDSDACRVAMLAAAPEGGNG